MSTNIWDLSPQTECNISQQIKIEIVTIAFLYPSLLSGWPYVGPAFDVALEDFRLKYLCFNISHHLISDQRLKSCSDLTADSDKSLASHFYRRREKSDQPNVVAFIYAGKHHRRMVNIA